MRRVAVNDEHVRNDGTIGCAAGGASPRSANREEKMTGRSAREFE
jgi:hypothetical protein